MKLGNLLLIMVIHCFMILELAGADIDGTSAIIFNDSSVELADGVFCKGFVYFADGFSLPAGASTTLNLIPPIRGAINLNATGTIILGNDLFLASNVTIPNGGIIDGQGNVVFLQGNLTIPRGKKIKIVSDTIIDGQGHELIFEHEARGVIGGVLSMEGAEGTTVTLRNITIKGLANYSSSRSINFGSSINQKLVLDNALLYLRKNFTFVSGMLKIHNEVTISGAHDFIFKSSYDCTIDKMSTLFLDMDVIFKYQPEDKKKNHIVMTDASSVLFLNGSTLNTPHTQGLVLTGGHLIVDHKSHVDGNGALRDVQGITFGDGTVENNIMIDFMPGASLTVFDGIISYNNVDEVIAENNGGHL
jgi:hypothetical protein